MGPAVLVFWVGVVMIIVGTRYRRTVPGTLCIIIGGVIVFVGIGMATISVTD